MLVTKLKLFILDSHPIPSNYDDHTINITSIRVALSNFNVFVLLSLEIYYIKVRTCPRYNTTFSLEGYYSKSIFLVVQTKAQKEFMNK